MMSPADYTIRAQAKAPGKNRAQDLEMANGI
jgi:hypothetical protein